MTKECSACRRQASVRSAEPSPSQPVLSCYDASPAQRHDIHHTGAGGDNGIDHNEN
eukprot:COSAG01_NODE_1289_length_10885_cov_3.769331_11_plen_56_part_00